MANLNDFSEKYYAKLWRSMDWERNYKMLENFQKQLSILAKNHDSNGVRSLQDKITNITEIRALAVHKVTDENNAGAGIDGVLWISDADKMRGAMSLNAADYEAKPFRRIIIQDKHKMKERHIGIPTVKDRAIQTLYSFVLDPVAEASADKKSFAFRNGRSALDAHHFISEALKYPDSPEWVFIGDIKSCYDSISHGWLMKHIPMNKDVLRSFLKAGFIFGNELFPTEQGISLGMSISPIIANMTLDGLRQTIFNLQPRYKTPDYGDGEFVRYADDIIVTARSKESAYKIKSAVKKFLSIRGLRLSETKSKIIHVSEGFDYLSRNYCKRDGILCVTPSEKAVKSFEQNLKDFILNNGKQQSQRNLIKGLNARLQGWAAYHRIEKSSEVFHHIDSLVSALLLKLMQKLYPNKTKQQLISTYWHEDFDGTKVYTLPQRKDIRVVRMKDIILIAHNPVILSKNPYIDTEYFKSRSESQDEKNINGRYKSVWKRQSGKCYYCGKVMAKEQPIKLIHRESIDDNSTSNLAYIHSTCEQDEAIFIQTDIENPSNIDVFEIAKEITEKDDTLKETSKISYSALKDYFSKCNENKFALKFSEIEKILKGKLCSLAYKYKSFWHRKSKREFADSWQSEGFEVSEIDFKKKKAYFHKTDNNRGKLSIPKVFLTDKIPNNAKYELEHFFEYIRKKYGIQK